MKAYYYNEQFLKQTYDKLVAEFGSKQQRTLLKLRLGQFYKS